MACWPPSTAIGRVHVGANLASAADVEAVQVYIDSVKPVTATVEVVAPVADPVNYSLAIVPPTDENKAAVQAALAELYFRDAVPEGGVSLNKSLVAIGSAGIEDFTLTTPLASPSAAAGEILTMGAITWV